MTAPESTRYRRARHVAWRRVGDEPVVINLEAKRLYGLNRCGGAVWDALAEERSVAQLVAMLAPAKNAAAAGGELRAFLDVLCEHGLLEAVPGASAAAVQPEEPAPEPWEAPAVRWSEGIGQTVHLPSQIYDVGDPNCGY